MFYHQQMQCMIQRLGLQGRINFKMVFALNQLRFLHPASVYKQEWEANTGATAAAASDAVYSWFLSKNLNIAGRTKTVYPYRVRVCFLPGPCGFMEYLFTQKPGEVVAWQHSLCHDVGSGKNNTTDQTRVHTESPVGTSPGVSFHKHSHFIKSEQIMRLDL